MEEVTRTIEAFKWRVAEKFPDAAYPLDLGIKPEGMHILDVFHEGVWLLVLYKRPNWGIAINELPNRNVDIGFGQIFPDFPWETEDEAFTRLVDILEHPDHY